MRLVETANTNLEYIYEQDTPIGVFKYLNIAPLSNTVILESSIEYYLGRSGYKLVSPLVENLILKYQKESITGNVPDINQLLANIIMNKYRSKWEKILQALTEKYNIFDEIDLTTTSQSQRNENHTGSKTDKITYNSSTNSELKKSTDETVIRNNEILDNVFGFNSVESVPKNFNNENNFERTTADANKNKINDNKINSGYDENVLTNNLIDTFISNDTKTRKGRVKEGSSILNNEIMVRTKNIILNIIFDDIDSILCLQIY